MVCIEKDITIVVIANRINSSNILTKMMNGTSYFNFDNISGFC